MGWKKLFVGEKMPDKNDPNTTVQRNFPIESTDHHRSFSSDVLV